MNEEIAKIRESLNTLENQLGQNESPMASPFSGLELPDIIRDVVDLLWPLLGTYETAFYLYMLRHSTGEWYVLQLKTSFVGSFFQIQAGEFEC
jgi:hypothetical protein